MNTGGLGYWIGAWWGTAVWDVWTRSALSWTPGSWIELHRNSDATLEAAEERYQAWRERREVRTVRLSLRTQVAA